MRFRMVLSALAFGLASCHSTGAPTPTVTQPAAAASATPTPAPDSIAVANRALVAEVLRQIAGRETQPAESVFKNVRLLKGVPARTFLSIMNGGYARALGVQCAHCHVTSDFSSDEKRPKRAAREMAVMHRMINGELAKMQEIATPATSNRAISCITCHRGLVNPR